MTDKDIKDYCKNCDVEPPAMRFKCPECEHNTDNENIFAKDIYVPSKEQIINLPLSYKALQLAYADYKKQTEIFTEELARKTQECEALKSERFTRESLITEQENEIDELRQKCEGLRNIVFYWEQIDKIQEDKLDRYRKALENLEEFCLNF